MAATLSKPALERTKIEAETAFLRVQEREGLAKAAAAELKLESMRHELADINASAHRARVYPFLGGVSRGTVAECMEVLASWSRRDPGEDIRIVFNSPGGSVLDGLALYDFLEELKVKGHHITTVARGMAASMGGVLLQSGDRRIVGANAQFLIHEVSAGAIGKVSEMEDELKFCQRLQDRLLAILALRSTMSEAQIRRKWKKTDWWLSADEVVEFGFADEIG